VARALFGLWLLLWVDWGKYRTLRTSYETPFTTSAKPKNAGSTSSANPSVAVFANHMGKRFSFTSLPCHSSDITNPFSTKRNLTCVS